MDYRNFEVGKEVMSPCADTIKFDITDGGAVMIVAMRNLTEKEIAAYSSGAIEFREIMLNGIIFILAKAAGLSWVDMPYHRDLAQGTIAVLTPEESQGLSLHFMLIEASTGVLKHQKMLGLSNNFTKLLYQDIIAQPAKDGGYNDTINAVYSRYSSADLAAMAKNYCKFK